MRPILFRGLCMRSLAIWKNQRFMTLNICYRSKSHRIRNMLNNLDSLLAFVDTRTTGTHLYKTMFSNIFVYLFHIVSEYIPVIQTDN
jgi:hypothetical protein